MRFRPLVLPARSALVAGVLVLGAAAPSGAVVEVQDWSDRLEVRVMDQPGAIQIRCADGRVQLEPGWGEGYSQCDRVRRIQVSLDHDGYEDVVEFDAFSDPRQFTALEGLTVLSPPDRRRDVVRGSHGSDHVTGDALDRVSTGAGNDVVTGDIEGPGVVSAGEGNDTIESGQVFDSFTGPSEVEFGSRVVDGGPGTDAWTAVLRLRDPRMVLDASGLSSGSRRMEVQGIENATLTLVEPTDFNAELFPGNLVLVTQGGNDRLVGARAYDSISSQGGDDWVWVRDGVADKVDCGAGADTVVADVADVVTNCETVTLPAPPPPAPGVPTPPPGTPTQPPGTPTPAPGVPTPPPGAPGGPGVPETGAVEGRKKVTKPRPARFRFSSSTPGATFECKVDRRSWNPCAAPYRVATRRLKPGKHLFKVRAVLAGQVDATPSRVRFKVKGARR